MQVGDEMELKLLKRLRTEIIPYEVAPDRSAENEPQVFTAKTGKLPIQVHCLEIPGRKLASRICVHVHASDQENGSVKICGLPMPVTDQLAILRSMSEQARRLQLGENQTPETYWDPTHAFASSQTSKENDSRPV